MYLETLPVGILQGIVLAGFSTCLGNSGMACGMFGMFFDMFSKQCGVACSMFGMFFDRFRKQWWHGLRASTTGNLGRSHKSTAAADQVRMLQQN